MEMLAAFIVSFAVTALVGGKMILPMLRRLKAGQAIREEGEISVPSAIILGARATASSADRAARE